jgi:hypothetical protein
MKDLRKFVFEYETPCGHRYSCSWGWKNTLSVLMQWQIGEHVDFTLRLGDRVICEARHDSGDEWKPYRVYWQRNIPRDLYLEIIASIKTGKLWVP